MSGGCSHGGDACGDGRHSVKAVSKRLGAVLAVTGAIDLVSDGQQCVVIRGGRVEMSRVTGTGCQLSGLAAAFLAVARNMEAPAGSTGGNTAEEQHARRAVWRRSRRQSA